MTAPGPDPAGPHGATLLGAGDETRVDKPIDTPMGVGGSAGDPAATITARGDVDATLIVPAGAPAAPAPDGGADADGPRRFGRYELLRRLGAGAMGEVWLARDTQLDRQVALKLPSAAAADDAELRERFLREARAAATLHHPHLCPVYDAGEETGEDGVPRLYLTMAYIKGQSLHDAATGAQPVRTAARLIRKLADAMAHAHDRGVVHRDLKPANVMLDEVGRLSITDFGLARRSAGKDGAARMTQDGAILGTPAYMSPEQITGDANAVGPQADIYALGVMLYELLTGRLPFEGSVMAVLGRALTEDPTPPGELRTEVDERIEGIWRKMVARDPAERYASMQEVFAALTDYLKGGGSIVGKPKSGPEIVLTEADALPDPIPAPNYTPPRTPPTRRRSGRRRKTGPAPRGLPAWALPAGLAAAGLLALLGVVTIVYVTPDGLPQEITVEVPGDVESASIRGDGPSDGGGPTDNGAGNYGDGGGADPGASGVLAEAEDGFDEATADPGWVALFNGRDLAGWGGNRADWSVENGLLAGAPAPSPDGQYEESQLTSERTFGDAELEAVYQLRGDVKWASVKTRSTDPTTRHAEAILHSPRNEILTGSIHSWAASAGSKNTLTPIALAAQAAAARATNGAPPGWDVLRLRTIGPDTTVWINGVQTATARLPNLATAGAVVLKVSRPGTGKAPGRMEFRSIRVRPLTPDGEPVAAAAEPSAQIPVGPNWIDLLADPVTGVPSLAAWEAWNGGPPPDDWELLPDGTLHLRAGSSKIDLSTREPHGDFELTFDWKISRGGNGGVIYRAETGLPQAYLSGPEYQILDDVRNRDGRTPLTRAGSLYALYPPAADAVRPAGEWNRGRVEARGPRLIHELNGTTVVEATVGSPEWDRRRGASKMTDWPRFAAADAGRIVLQDHGSELWLRNVRVRPFEGR